MAERRAAPGDRLWLPFRRSINAPRPGCSRAGVRWRCLAPYRLGPWRAGQGGGPDPGPVQYPRGPCLSPRGPVVGPVSIQRPAAASPPRVPAPRRLLPGSVMGRASRSRTPAARKAAGRARLPLTTGHGHHGRAGRRGVQTGAIFPPRLVRQGIGRRRCGDEARDSPSPLGGLCVIFISAHPRERGDPVLWVLQRVRIIHRSSVLKHRRQAGQDWVPAFAGMSGKF